MNTTPAKTDRRQPVADALPEDDALRELADVAFSSRPATTARGLAAVPTTSSAGAAAAGTEDTPAPDDGASLQGTAAQVPAVTVSGPAADLTEATETEPGGDPRRNFIRQATIQVDAQVAARFRNYQVTEAARTKARPSNVEVVFAALRAAEGNYREIVESRRPKVPDSQRWGRPVPGRRTGAPRLSAVINYRPTVGELDDITQLATESGADSVSAFLNILLDDFLPQARARSVRL